jgi:hypothetical protein
MLLDIVVHHLAKSFLRILFFEGRFEQSLQAVKALVLLHDLVKFNLAASSNAQLKFPRHVELSIGWRRSQHWLTRKFQSWPLTPLRCAVGISLPADCLLNLRRFQS